MADNETKAGRRYGKTSKSDDDELVDEEGKPAKEGFRELRTKKGWEEEKEKRKKAAADKELEGTKDRGVGEHILAGARAVFEGEKYREAVAKDRDPKNALYDRRRSK